MKLKPVRSTLKIAVTLFVILLIFSCGNAQPQAEIATTSEPKAEYPKLTEDQLEGRVHAPDFPDGLQWLNSVSPISISHLQGKVVVLDFWTFCCINCMHVLPDLKKLEDKYAKELIVIGVHSAKFTNEKDADAIREAILRYEIKHPVVNDNEFQIWQQYGVNAWPSFAIINPAGRVVGMHSGEDVFDLFDNIIGQLVAYFDSSGTLTRSSVSFGSEAMQQDQSLLKYPGKIIADATGTRLFISDSNRNRVIAMSLDGKIEFVIGSGIQGNQDGTFTEARFNRPQGLVLDGDVLFVADTENHSIRAANLKSKKVTTVLGTGAQARETNIPGSGVKVALNSPWDLTIQDDKMYIAMAGPHQLWVADRDSWNTEPFAGSGQEARVDAPLLQAALAQPSGITSDGKKLFFADSETSSIRSADLDRQGQVATIIGVDLFDFGDIDGDSLTARLQHPLGVYFHEGQLYVADTYNHKIKIVDPDKHTSRTLIGSGKRGYKDGSFSEAELNEPSGLVVVGNRMFVADCNNHQIRVVDLVARSVSTLQFSDLAPVAERTMDAFSGREIRVQPNKIRSGSARISVGLIIPEGNKLNDLAPFYVDFKSPDDGAVKFTADPSAIQLNRTTGEFEIPFVAGAGETTITLETVVYLCKENSPACLFDMIRIHVPIVVDAKGPSMFGIGIPVRTQPRI